LTAWPAAQQDAPGVLQQAAPVEPVLQHWQLQSRSMPAVAVKRERRRWMDFM
jgi:hypothetical protein